MRLSAIFLIGLSFMISRPADSKSRSDSPHIATYEELMNLSSEQRGEYLLMIQRMMVELARNGEPLASLNLQHNNVFLRLLFDYADAQSSEAIRCIYGGFFIRGEKCEPVKSVQIKTSDSGELKTLTCGQEGEGLCNPLLFGLNSDGEGICLHRSSNFTEQCASVSKASKTGLALLAKLNSNQWKEFHDSFSNLCDVTSFNSNGYFKNSSEAQKARFLKDVSATCQAAKTFIAKNDYWFISANSALAKASTSKTSQADDKSIKKISETSGASKAGKATTAESPFKAPSVCSHFGAHSSALYCYACSIEASERASNPNTPNYTISDNWLALMQVCRGQFDSEEAAQSAFRSFGYCAQADNWNLNTSDNELIKALNALSKPGAKLTPEMRSAFFKNFGVTVKTAKALFCSGNTRNLLNFVNTELPERLSSADRDHRKKLVDCAKDALALTIEKSDDGNDRYVASSFISRFAKRSCEFKEIPADTAKQTLARTRPVITFSKGCTIATELSGKQVHMFDPQDGRDYTESMERFQTSAEKIRRQILECDGDGSKPAPNKPEHADPSSYSI